MKRLPMGFLATVPLLAILSARPAHAIDGCSMFDGNTQTGAQMAALLVDDVTVPAFSGIPEGKTGFGSATATGFGTPLPKRANSLAINAGFSDIHLDFWFAATVPAIPDDPITYGGDGTFFQGAVHDMKCPKGSACNFTMAAQGQNVNQGWRCMRQYPNHVVTVPLQQSQNYLYQGAPVRGIQEEWRDKVTERFQADNSIDAISNVKAYVTIEPTYSACSRTGGCSMDATNVAYHTYTDQIRLHWDAQVNPNVQGKDCIAEPIITCAAVPFCPLVCGVVCAYDLITGGAPVCNTVVGTKHVNIDLWLEPRAINSKTAQPLQFFKSLMRVSVQSGTGSAQLASTITSRMNAVDIGKIVAAGVFDALGRRYCDLVGSADPDCPDVTVPYSQVGGKFLGQFSPLNASNQHTTWPKRVELMYDNNPTNPVPDYEVWGPLGSVTGVRFHSPESLVVNMDRNPQF